MTNRLARETSPYLLQHAENPVDWYPWGEEALNRARAEDKPILLSIGYSACHWCHVMAHECFENPEIARLMNETFVNIKVDREERPDLDSVYMATVQAIAGSGGWPLTVFLTPEGKPFFGGTYFPPEDRSGQPGFPRVLQAVADAYRRRRGDVERAIKSITAALTPKTERAVPGELLAIDILKQAYRSLQQDFDRVNGGFGSASKFPQPLVLEFLLRYHQRTQDAGALAMVELTLEKMARGGMYDQVGGGFHRYATDRRWLVPHFEKMLYDNAQLSQVYLHAYLVTGKPFFRRVVEGTLDYTLREMTDSRGGFYSTQDADSEGVEGKYYLWISTEIDAVLGEAAGEIVRGYFGVTAEGNFEGQNILHMARDIGPGGENAIDQARLALWQRREQRVKPGRDEKVLASWNGLMLASLAEAAGVLERSDYLAAAVANGSFLLNSMVQDGYLKHGHMNGQAKIEGYLEDYALVIEGLLALHQLTFKGEWLRQAKRLAERMVELFWDKASGVFYDTGERHERLFIRPRSTFDNAMPSGSSAATFVLLKLARIGVEGFEPIAAASLRAMRAVISGHPLGAGHWLCALDFYLSTPKEIAVIGPRENAVTQELMRVLYRTWLPNKVFAAGDPTDPTPADTKLLENRTMMNAQPTVYVCERNVCRAPITDSASLPALLR